MWSSVDDCHFRVVPRWTSYLTYLSLSFFIWSQLWQFLLCWIVVKMSERELTSVAWHSLRPIKSQQREAVNQCCLSEFVTSHPVTGIRVLLANLEAHPKKQLQGSWEERQGRESVCLVVSSSQQPLQAPAGISEKWCRTYSPVRSYHRARRRGYLCAGSWGPSGNSLASWAGGICGAQREHQLETQPLAIGGLDLCVRKWPGGCGLVLAASFLLFTWKVLFLCRHLVLLSAPSLLFKPFEGCSVRQCC